MIAQYFLDPVSSFPKCAIRFLFYLGRGGVIFENITAFFIQANTLKMFVVYANYCKEEKKGIEFGGGIWKNGILKQQYYSRAF